MNPALNVIGWSLIHFVWQGAALGLFAALALRLMRSASAQTRYCIACATLAAMMLAPLGTASTLLADAERVVPPAGRTVVRIEMTRRLQTTDDVEDVRHATATPIPPAPPSTRVVTFMVFAWLAGVCLLILRLGGSWWSACRLQRRARALTESKWQLLSQCVAARLGIARLVRVVDADVFDSPTLIGWLSPVIVLPIAALAQLSPAQVEAILAHELAHVRRHDYLVNLLQTLAETLLFYHPAVWWLSRRIRDEREHCCDDLAVGLSGDPVAYAEALTELEAFRSAPPQLAMAVTGGALVHRVRRVLGHAGPHEGRPPAAFAVMTLVALILVTAGAARYVAAGPQATVGAPPGGQIDRIQVVWRQFETDHFDLLVPPAIAAQRTAIQTKAEQAYGAISDALRHELSTRVRLMIFESRDAMDRVLRSGLMPPGDPASPLIAIPVDSQNETSAGTMLHEVTHAFEAEILGTLDAPLWLKEGLAEHMTGVWRPAERGRIVQMLGARTVPGVGDLSRAPANPEDAYAIGHALFDFLAARWGKAGVRQLLAAYRATDGRTAPMLQLAFGIDEATFDREFESYLRRVMLPPPPPPPPPAGNQIAEETVRPGSGASPKFWFSGDRIAISNATLRDLIRFAYGLEDGELSGGPAWISSDRFDVVTTGDGDGSHYGSAALRDVVTRRFGVELRQDEVQVPVYALTSVAGGQSAPALTASTLDCASIARNAPPARLRIMPRPFCGLSWMELGRAFGRGVTMPMLAQQLGRSRRIGREVIDRTGMKGAYDFTLDFSPALPGPDRVPMVLSRAAEWTGLRPSLPDALREQLGLELVEDTAPSTIFVVDRAERPGRD